MPLTPPPLSLSPTSPPMPPPPMPLTALGIRTHGFCEGAELITTPAACFAAASELLNSSFVPSAVLGPDPRPFDFTAVPFEAIPFAPGGCIMQTKWNQRFGTWEKGFDNARHNVFFVEPHVVNETDPDLCSHYRSTFNLVCICANQGPSPPPLPPSPPPSPVFPNAISLVGHGRCRAVPFSTSSRGRVSAHGFDGLYPYTCQKTPYDCAVHAFSGPSNIVAADTYLSENCPTPA